MNLLLKVLLLAGVFCVGSYGTYKVIDTPRSHGESLNQNSEPQQQESDQSRKSQVSKPAGTDQIKENVSEKLKSSTVNPPAEKLDSAKNQTGESGLSTTSGEGNASHQDTTLAQSKKTLNLCKE